MINTNLLSGKSSYARRYPSGKCAFDGLHAADHRVYTHALEKSGLCIGKYTAILIPSGLPWKLLRGDGLPRKTNAILISIKVQHPGTHIRINTI